MNLQETIKVLKNRGHSVHQVFDVDSIIDYGMYAYRIKYTSRLEREKGECVLRKRIEKAVKNNTQQWYAIWVYGGNCHGVYTPSELIAYLRRYVYRKQRKQADKSRRKHQARARTKEALYHENYDVFSRTKDLAILNKWSWD